MKERLSAIKKLLLQQQIDAFIVPSYDEFHSEYTPQHAKRLEWLTGFTGSNGVAIVTINNCAFFTDSRYSLQAKLEVSDFEIFDLAITSVSSWIKANMQTGSVIGYDPNIHSENSLKNFIEVGSLLATENLIDKLWHQRPQKQLTELRLHDQKYAGLDSDYKRKMIATQLSNGADACIIAAPDSVCWLLNIRASDISFTPLALVRAIIYKNAKLQLFTDYIGQIDLGSEVEILGFDQLPKILQNMNGLAIQIDPAITPISIVEQLKNCHIIEQTDPCQLPKACKNKTEIAGAIIAHKYDAIALCKFFAWLEQNQANATEMTIAEKLLELRSLCPEFVYPSFATIAGFAENGAIVHYSANIKTNKTILGDGILLIDSGGQYRSGTTDITRTISIGTPTSEQIDNFTRVLKGHIAIARAQFPASTTGAQLDILARYHLWQVGLDYGHGTGHGVGSFLGVHEGPQRIFPSSQVCFHPGMIVSNEPGYYKDGEYGIRIESLLLVEKYQQFLRFKTLSLVPIDNKLINKAMLHKVELEWLNQYHNHIYQTLKDEVDDATRKWLINTTLTL
jgi:Xaa-Pro aminopeptidase